MNDQFYLCFTFHQLSAFAGLSQRPSDVDYVTDFQQLLPSLSLHSQKQQ